MSSLVYLVETLFVVLLGWVIIQLWTNCINACCVSWGLNSNSAIHTAVVAGVFTIILIAFIRCSGQVGNVFETHLEGNELNATTSLSVT